MNFEIFEKTTGVISGILCSIFLWVLIIYYAPVLVLFSIFFTMGVISKKKKTELVAHTNTLKFLRAWFYSPIIFMWGLGYLLGKPFQNTTGEK